MTTFEYFTFDQLDSSYKKIMHIEDDLMMELYSAEYKWADVRTKLWAKNKEISFLTGLRIIGLDDVGVVNKITNIISGELKINIAALTIESTEGLFQGTIKVYVHDKDELEVLVDKIKSLNGIQRVDRFDTESV